MKITVKPGPDWRKAIALMRNYDKRLAYVQEQLCENIAEVFLKALERRVPSGDKFQEYMDSLRVVQLTGTTPGVAWAVVSDRKKVKIQELRGREQDAYVVYVEPTSFDNPLVQLVSSHNPWPVDMLPNGLPAKEVELIHRPVTIEELNFVKGETATFLSREGYQLKRLGSSWEGSVDDAESSSGNMTSLPDFMWLGLRTEFGINAAANPHWKPAAREVAGKVGEIINGNDNIQKALYDSVFRKYLESSTVDPNNQSAEEFTKEAGKFSNKISKVAGVKK